MWVCFAQRSISKSNLQHKRHRASDRFPSTQQRDAPEEPPCMAIAKREKSAIAPCAAPYAYGTAAPNGSIA